MQDRGRVEVPISGSGSGKAHKYFDFRKYFFDFHSLLRGGSWDLVTTCN